MTLQAFLSTRFFFDISIYWQRSLANRLNRQNGWHENFMTIMMKINSTILPCSPVRHYSPSYVCLTLKSFKLKLLSYRGLSIEREVLIHIERVLMLVWAIEVSV